MLPWVPETFHGRFQRFRSSLTAPVISACGRHRTAFFSHASKKPLPRVTYMYIYALNLTKTNFMIFHPRQKIVNVDVPLTLENTVINKSGRQNF